MRLLHGKAIAITGTAQGIGKATAMASMREGAAVAICDINGALARTVADTVVSAGGREVAVAIDASRQEDINRMLAE